MSTETKNDIITDSGSGANSSGSSGSSGSTNSSDVVNDKDVERALANPAGLSQEMVARFLEHSDSLKPELVKELSKLDKSSLGMKDEELQLAERQQEQREQQQNRGQQVEEAVPEHDDVDPLAVIAEAKSKTMDKAYAQGKNAWEGVEDAHKVGQALGGKTTDQLADVKEALAKDTSFAASIDSAVAGLKGLMAGNMLASTKDMGMDSPAVSPKDTDAKAVPNVTPSLAV